MGLFDIIKPKKTVQGKKAEVTRTSDKNVESHFCYVDSSSISEDERPYYKPDKYYTLYANPGTYMERRVITFEERKKFSYPSLNGLYVGEILLLEYCKSRTYPKPKNGYPGFWWFEYGIRDIGHALESLYKRGFLHWSSTKETIEGYKVDQLKRILQNEGLSTTGKKKELVERICAKIPEEKISILPDDKKYELTELGKRELMQNGYVPYMHKHPYKTTEDERFGVVFNVWSINKLFPNGDASNWKQVVGKIELDRFGVDMADNVESVDLRSNSKSTNHKSECNEMRQFLKDNNNEILKGIRNLGDGYKEEEKGLSYKRIGKDKEALIQFYIAIGKKFDAPALYRETAILLRKYGMYEEELNVINQGLDVIPKNNNHRNELLKRRDKVLELIKQTLLLTGS